MNISLILAAITASPFSFEGGSVQQFVNSASKHLNQPIVALAVDTKVSKVRLNWPVNKNGKSYSEEKGLEVHRKGITDHYSSTSLVDGVMAMSPTILPWYRFSHFHEGRNLALTYQDDFDIIEVKNGQVRLLPTKDRYLMPAYLPFKKFSKKVICHKFLLSSPIVVSEGSLSELSFLSALSFAMGGTLEEREDSFFIDVNLKSLRSKLVALFVDKKNKSTTKLERARHEFQAEAMKIVPESKLRDMVEKDNSVLVFKLPLNSRANIAARAYTRLYIAEVAKSANRDPRAIPQIAELITNRGNFNRAFRCSITTTGRVEAMIMFGADAGGVAY